MSKYKRILVPLVIIGLIVAVWAFTGGGTGAAEMDASDEYVTRLTTSQEFTDQVLGAQKPVLVDFYATRCPPCRKLAPRIHKLARAYEGRVKFTKVNVDKSRELAQQYGVSYLPTVIIFNQGKVAFEPLVGLKGEDVYSKALDRAIVAGGRKE